MTLILTRDMPISRLSMSDLMHLVRRGGPRHSVDKQAQPQRETEREHRLFLALATVLSINVFAVSTVLSLGFLLIFVPR